MGLPVPNCELFDGKSKYKESGFVDNFETEPTDYGSGIVAG